AIAGEDCGLLIFEFSGGPIGMWDANRYNESNFADPRYTFGEFLVEGNGGAIRLYGDGRLTMQHLGEAEQDHHQYIHTRQGPGGDSVHATQRHFVERLLDGQPFETGGEEYLKTLTVQEACYLSAERRAPVGVSLLHQDRMR
ncbi:MAG: gfo/Idh/MocA family oxidoreductase, partial [Planctomycetes bacterium]|nr:gfo/Idh/MocA family oxidoreductase [Planctomycetota bacterium]